MTMSLRHVGKAALRAQGTSVAAADAVHHVRRLLHTLYGREARGL